MNKIYSEKDFENHFENGLKLNGYKTSKHILQSFINTSP